MGFNAALITFNPATLIRAQDVNSNFTALNNVATFNGGTATMNFEAGTVTSDGNGNIRLATGKIGVTTAGDIIDASGATDLFVKAGGASGQISFYIDSILTVAVTTNGLSIFQGGLVFGGLPNKSSGSTTSSTKTTTVTLQTETGGPSSISRTSTFTGSATGTYNHNNNGIPDWIAPLCTSAGNFSGNNWDSPTPTTVHIYDDAGLPFIAYAVGF
jgi:hypothetical protein